MKRIALIVLSLLALAAPAFGQVGDISLYADDQGNSCDITDPGGFWGDKLFVVHKFQPGEESIGIRFKIVPPVGATWTFISFSSTYTTVGGAGDDLSVGYGVCQTTTTLVGAAIVNSAVPAPACSYVSIGPGLPGILGLACNFAEIPIRHGEGIVNGNGGCPCNVAVETTSWGKVKALYR